MRTLLIAALAAVSVVNPSFAFQVGPVIAVVVIVLGGVARLKVTSAMVAVVLLLMWVTLSTAWANDDNLLITLLTWGVCGLAFIAVITTIETREQLRTVCVGYLIGAVYSVLRTIVFVSAGHTTGDRVTEIGGVNVNYFAYSLATGVAVIVLLWVTGHRTWKSAVLLLATATTLIIGIEVTQTRGAYLGIALVVIWIIAWRVFRLRSPIGTVVGVVLAALLIVTGLTDQASLGLEGESRATGDWSGRLPIWEVARQVWLEQPIVGAGIGGFQQEVGTNIATHNAVLEVGATFGIIGVLLYCAVFWAALGPGSRGVPRRERALLIGCYLAAAAPAFLTGAWVTAPAAWVALAVFARLQVLASDRYATVPVA